MKKKLMLSAKINAAALVFNLLIVFSGFAQVVIIEESDIVGPGNRIPFYEDVNPDPSIVPGSAGMNQTWDFSDLEKENVDTIIFMNPSELPKFTQFPDATMGYYTTGNNDSAWAFMRVSGGFVGLTGLVGVDEVNGDTIGVEFEMQFLQTPSSLGTKYEHNYKISDSSVFLGLDPDGPGPLPYVDSLRLSYNRITKSEIDAEGTLIIPSETFRAQRQFVTNIFADSVFMYANGNWTLLSPSFSMFLGMDSISFDTTYSYSWWSDQGTGFILVDIPYDVKTNTVTDPVIWREDSLSITDGIASINSVKVKVFPNPTSDVLRISLQNVKSNGAVEFKLYDLQGKSIVAQILNNPTETIDLGSFASGTYVYEVTQSNSIVANGKLILK